MIMTMKQQLFTYLYIMLIIIAFIAVPLIATITAILIVAYWYKIEPNRTGEALRQLLRANSSMILIIAFVLTLASLAINYTAEYVTKYGFPTTFVTYYTYPGIAESNDTWFGILRASLAINPLQAALNTAIYFLLLRIIQKIWRNRQINP